MIQANSIKLSFGNRVLFDSISFDINENQKIGLIGANGSGKSTLLEVLVGITSLDEGFISIPKTKKVAYLAQEVVLSSQMSIIDEIMTAFEQINKLKIELELMEEELTQGNEVDLEHYAELHEKLADTEPDAMKAEAKKMLLGLGFKDTDFDRPVSELSEGWRMRIVLAKLLLQKADFYLFDEPTNHLDIFAKDWFLDFLKSAPFGFMLVCHERHFLDAVCKQVYELERGKCTIYQGNYSKYLVQKERNLEILQSQFALQQKEIKQKEETINRFKASASRAKQAQSMMKQLDKLDRIELPPGQRSINFSFPPITRSGSIVLKVEDVAHGFEGKELFNNVNFEIERGQKVALVASNGVGKSTLLNIIMGKLKLQHGKIIFGSGVTYTLFDQDQNRALDQKKSVIDNIEGHCPPGTTTAAMRSMLGAFLFSGEDVYKKIEVLSGGEKNRVGMVRVLLQRTNFLLLDEPTNHLDLDAKRILLEALRNYDGTILFVSHDRAFLNDLATRVIELTPTGIISFTGNYDEFLYYKQQMAASSAGQAKISKVDAILAKDTQKPASNDYERAKKINTLERKVQQLEKKIKEQELAFVDLRYGTNEYKKAEQTLNLLKTEHAQSMQEWEELLKA
ncbi:ABC-F family ATP-binding cassette domain-containing protein [soil metagenome]